VNQRILPVRDFTAHASAYQIVLLILAVAGIVLGILSMHFVNPASVEDSSNGHGVVTSAHGHSESGETANAATGPSPATVLVAANDACGSVCGPELCLAVGMACAVALIVLSVRPRRSLRRSLTLLPLGVVRRLLILKPLRLPPTPSLIALSISRT